ncbi:MAG: sensor histidine kinase [Steroidobacteraceae bacterium]
MPDPITDFLEVLAHALRNPLVPVRAAAEELRMTAADPNSQRMGEIIYRQVEHMERMLNALLDLSLLQRGRLQLAHSSVELLRVIESAVEQCRPALESKSQRLIVDMPEHAARIAGDEPRLVQIVRNLLDNAVKFTPDGGSIHLSIAAKGSEAQIRVQDTGCGLTPAILAGLFERFVPTTSTAHAEAGVGLSLSITKHLVELHRGTIRADSAGPGQGSQFSVSLPLETPEN